MLYTNKNIFMPFREEEKNNRSLIKDLSKEYYESLGYNVILLDSDDEVFNLSKSRNLAITEYDDEIITIINSDCIVEPYSLEISIKLAEERPCVVKPLIQLFRFLEIDLEFLNIIKNNEILEINSESQSNGFYTGGAFIINRAAVEEIGLFNENINDERISSMEFCLRSSIISELIFLECNAYTTHHSKLNKNISGDLEIYSINQLFFNEEKNIYIYDIYGNLRKLTREKNNTDSIFNLDNII